MKLRPTRRVVVGALVAIVVLIASFVGVNVYLNTEYLPRLIGAMRPGLALQYEFAWTIWPGTVHVENLSLRGEEPGFSWQLEVRRASASANLSSLTGDVMRVDSLSLSGVRAKVRPKLHPLQATPERLAHLPFLPGEAPSDVLAEGPSLPPDQRRALDPWRIEVEKMRVHDLRELWIDVFRFEGRVDASGSVSLDAGRVARFGSTEVNLRDGQLSIEGQVAAKQLRGEADVSLGPVDLYEARGLAHFATASGQASVEAQVQDLGFLREIPGLPVPLVLEGGHGPVKARIAVKEGQVQPASEVEWSSDSVQVHLDGFDGEGAVSLRAVAEFVDGEPRTRMRANLAGARLGRPDQPLLMKSEAIALELDAPNLDLHRLSSFPEDLVAAWAKWPARLKLEAPTTSGQQRALQWWASFGKIDTELDLSKLAEHRIVLRRAEVDGARVRIRPRVQKSDATAAYVALLPPISDMPPPLCTESAARALSARAERNRWSIELERGAVSNVSEVWLEAYRFEGRASAKGGFRYAAGGRLEAGPVEAQIKSGTLRLAKWKAAAEVQGELQASLSPTDLDEASGYGFFRGLTARASVRAVLEQVDFLRHFPDLPVPAELGGGRGPLSARVSLKDGVVQTGSVVNWSSPNAQAATHGYRVVGPLSLEAKWGDSVGEPKMRLDARISPYQVTRVDSTRALVGGNLLTLRMDAAPFDLSRPAFQPFSSLQVNDGQVPDLRVLNEYVPSDLPLKAEQGSGTFTGRVAWPHQGAASAELKIGGKQAELIYDKTRLKGDWSIEAKLGNVNLATAAADILQATVLIDDMAMREGSRSRDGWFGRVDVTGGKVRPGQKVLLEADVDTTLRDGRPLVALFIAETEALPGWVRTLVTLQSLRATARVRLGEGLLEVDGINARGQSMEIRGRMRRNGTRQWGDMMVKSRGQEVGVAVRGNRFELKLLRAAEWYRQQMLDPRW